MQVGIDLAILAIATAGGANAVVKFACEAGIEIATFIDLQVGIDFAIPAFATAGGANAVVTFACEAGIENGSSM